MKSTELVIFIGLLVFVSHLFTGLRPLQNYFQDVLYKLLLFSNFAL